VWEPYVPESYIVRLAIFWGVFGLLHTLFALFDPLSINAILKEDATDLKPRPYYAGLKMKKQEEEKQARVAKNLAMLESKASS
jgi:hypothetical protein